MSKAFYIPDYWPQPSEGEAIKFDYGLGVDGKRVSFACRRGDVDGRFIEEDFIDEEWQAQWVLDYFTPRGLLEVADVYPSRGLYKWISERRTMSFRRGFEIPWGNWQGVGDFIETDIKVDVMRSTFFTPPKNGVQRVLFLARHDVFVTADGKNEYRDVIEFAYDQKWGDRWAGSHSWYARGLGQVQLVWRGNCKDVGGPMVASISKIPNQFV